jgi:uncharacterized coiled-coil DUF342 family protein
MHTNQTEEEAIDAARQALIGLKMEFGEALLAHGIDLSATDVYMQIVDVAAAESAQALVADCYKIMELKQRTAEHEQKVLQLEQEAAEWRNKLAEKQKEVSAIREETAALKQKFVPLYQEVAALDAERRASISKAYALHSFAAQIGVLAAPIPREEALSNPATYLADLDKQISACEQFQQNASATKSDERPKTRAICRKIV